MEEDQITDHLIDVENALTQALSLVADIRQEQPQERKETPRARPRKRPPSEKVDPLFLAEEAQRQILDRKVRQRFVPNSLLGEPVWEMLLDLFVCQANRKLVSVTSLCHASQSPATTALRYITLMEESGLVERIASDADRRVKYIRMTTKTFAAMSLYLAMVSRTRFERSAGDGPDEALHFTF